MNDFRTIYRKDYVPHPVKRPNHKEFFIESEYDDPINEAFKSHVHVEETNERECLEEIYAFYENRKDKYPAMEKLITKNLIDKNVICVRKEGDDIINGVDNIPVDKKVIKKEQMYDGRSKYQVDFCDIEKELEYKEWIKRTAVVLPIDIDIPLTTQKSSFRQPEMLNSRCYVKDPAPKAQNNLLPDYKFREITKVTTGRSDYTNKIGRLGREIIDLELHGPVHHDFK